ncbi:MAG: SpoIIE family protein phosphatase [Pirellulaceae bacterium]|nr:SpoIIE family protein phosphatase [Pirellulaceae bacterium]
MTKTIPNYLRVHRGPGLSAPVETKRSHETVENFWQAYTDVTGWRVDEGSPQKKAKCKLLPAVGMDLMSGMEQHQETPTVAKSSAQRLAESAASLAAQLEETRQTLRQQSAELSARAAIVNENARGELATSVEASLQNAAAACQCDSAAMYLLDNDTQFLTIRSTYALPPTRMSAPQRELRGSRGDLEAMIQGVVVMNDLNATLGETYCSPEPAGSAICAAIMNAGVPIGTLWLYADEPSDFQESQIAAAKLAASELALRLQCAATSGTPKSKPDHDATSQLATWQFAGLPIGTQLAPGWRVDGMIESPRSWATGWHTWDVLPDGTLMLAIAEADDHTIAGAMTATVARAALTAHTGYRHSPQQLLQRVSDTLWQSSTMDQLTSLLYARIDPETGEGELAAAGSMTAMIASRYGYRPLIEGNQIPLASRIDMKASASTFRMMAGEVFLSHSRGLASDGISQMLLGNHLSEAMRNSDSCPLASIRRSLTEIPMKHERGAVTILRQ